MNSENNNIEEELSIVDLLVRYLFHWRLFLVSIVVCILAAFAYLRYATPEYKVSSKVVIKDEKKGQVGMDVTAFQDLGIMSANENLENELEVLRSRSLLREVMDTLDLQVTYFMEGRLKKTEIYKQTPVLVSVPEIKTDGTFIIDRGNDQELVLSSEDPEFKKTILPEEPMETPWGELTFSLNGQGRPVFPIIVRLSQKPDVDLLTINAINKTSSVVELSMTTACPEKGRDVINTLVDLYNRKAIEEKNYAARNTDAFIDERLVAISSEYKDAAKSETDYKESQGLINVEAETQLYLTASSQYSQQITSTTIQLDLLRSIKDFLNKPENAGRGLPTNLGITDPTVVALIARYNQEVLEKEKMTVGMTENHLIAKEYAQRIASIKIDLQKGIDITEKSLQTTLAELRKKENSYVGKAVGLSTKERELSELYRQKEIKSTLFNYLLQKKEETGLSLVLATPNAKVLDRAEASSQPVSPKKKIVLLAAFLLGILIPVIYIYIIGIFDNKVRSKKQLTEVLKAPFLGEIPQAKEGDPFPVLKLRSAIAERFRMVSSNIEFIAGTVQGDKIIAVTSTQSGEGKSYFSRNLALSMATVGKKVLLVDLDMRRSQMGQIVELKQEKGMAVYLSHPDTKIDEIIDTRKKMHENLDIVPTVVFPPNPAELLASSRLDDFFRELKGRYDYIILDTAPLGLVADVLRINQFASACIYVVRENYTLKGSLTEVQELYKDRKLHNLTCVLNAVSEGKGYGKYGYGKSGYGNKSDYYHDDK